MSSNLATTIILSVLFVTVLIGWIVWVLGNRNNRVNSELLMLLVRRDATDYPHNDHHEHALVDHNHEHMHDDHAKLDHNHEHNHDEHYARLDHGRHHGDHDHTHKHVPLHSHPEVDELNLRVYRLERQSRSQNTALMQSPWAIWVGAIFGALIGALVGYILDLTLPSRVFDIIVKVVFHVNGQDIPQDLTAYFGWAKWGVPFACSFAGFVLGALIMLIVGWFRARRETIEVRGGM